MPDLVVRHARPEDMASVRRLCWAYRDLLVERAPHCPEIVEHYYAEGDYAALLDTLEEKHARPKGAIYVAEHEGEIVGCGMTHEVAPGLTEIKRVYVTTAARGLGAAQAIFRAAMHDARASGSERMVLDTMAWLSEAIGLYGKLGFTPAAPFYPLDPRFSDHILFFGIDLA